MELIPGKDFHLELSPKIGNLSEKDRQEVESWLREVERKMGEEFTIDTADLEWAN